MARNMRAAKSDDACMLGHVSACCVWRGEELLPGGSHRERAHHSANESQGKLGIVTSEDPSPFGTILLKFHLDIPKHLAIIQVVVVVIVSKPVRRNTELLDNNISSKLSLSV